MSKKNDRTMAKLIADMFLPIFAAIRGLCKDKPSPSLQLAIAGGIFQRAGNSRQERLQTWQSLQELLKLAQESIETFETFDALERECKVNDQYDVMDAAQLQAAVESQGWPWQYVWDPSYTMDSVNDPKQVRQPTKSELQDVRQWLRARDQEIPLGLLQTSLLLVDLDVPLDHIAGWTRQVQWQVLDWASAVHYAASDNEGVFVPSKPQVLNEYGSAEKSGAVIVYRPINPKRAPTDYLAMEKPGNPVGAALCKATVFPNKREAEKVIAKFPDAITDAHHKPTTVWIREDAHRVRYECLFEGEDYFETVEQVYAALAAYRGSQVSVLWEMANRRGLDHKTLSLFEIKALIVEEAEASLETSNPKGRPYPTPEELTEDATAKAYYDALMAIANRIPVVCAPKGAWSPDPRKKPPFDKENLDFETKI